jgi:hypothetical protein
MRAGRDPGLPAPAICPVTVDELLSLSVADLAATFKSDVVPD